MMIGASVRRLTLSAGALALATALAACGSDEQDGGPGDAADAAAAAETGACDYPDDEAGEVAKEVEKPPAEPEVSGEVPVSIETTAGSLQLTLDADAAPCTVNSFVSLAEQGYYDDSSCHRLAATQGFSMLQCGDPTGTGAGGPGYTIPDELEETSGYPAGTVAMAKRQAPDSGGGQFFLVFGDTELPPQYTVFGSFDSDSIAVLEKVAQDGHDDAYGDGTGAPTQEVTFSSVTVG